MKTQKMNALDRLVRELTAFKNWNDMLACLKKGYCPTLNGGRQHAKLAEIVRRNGFKVFRLGRVY